MEKPVTKVVSLSKMEKETMEVHLYTLTIHVHIFWLLAHEAALKRDHNMRFYGD